MSSGNKRMIINTRERAISSDNNRSAAFAAADRATLLARAYNDPRQNSYLLPGVAVQPSAVAAPLLADVYGGLMVDPGVSSLLITPGSLGCYFPDPGATSDDSPYILVNDPGITSTGVLTFTANGGPGIRIDLVECQPVDTLLETSSRDIYNTTTGLFTAAVVEKVRAFRLQYRIRLGTAGSGVPAVASGWLPLAAVIVSTTASDFTTCDFYDVRPLVEDRVARAQPAYIAGSFQQNQYSPVRDAEYFSQVVSGATLIQGYAESQFGGYVAGGWLRRSSPSFSGSFIGTGNGDGDPDFINVSLAENQAAGAAFAPGANSIVYLVAFFPAALPRWVRYSHSAVGGGFGRVPKGPRGIILATTAPPLFNGVYPPSVTPGHGFTVPAPGVVLGTLVYNSGGTDFIGVNAQGSFHMTQGFPSLGLAVTRTSSTQLDFPLVAGTHYPENASELVVSVTVNIGNSGGLDLPNLTAITVNGTIGQMIRPNEILPVAAGGQIVTVTYRIPLNARPDPTNAGGPNTTLRLTLQGVLVSVFSATANAHTLTVFGWRLGS